MLDIFNIKIKWNRSTNFVFDLLQTYRRIDKLTDGSIYAKKNFIPVLSLLLVFIYKDITYFKFEWYVF